MPTTERTIKITFLGGPETGKSTLVQALLGDRITYLNTDEISVSQHAIEIDDEKLTLQYRDFASNLSPQVAAITKTYLSTTHLFIGCFDLTRAENSLTRLKIMLLTQCHLAPNATIIIVGTGADLTGQYSKRNVKSLFSAFMADLNTSTLKNRIVGNTYLPVSDIIKPSIENLKKTIATQIKHLPKPTPSIGDTTMPAQLPETTPGTSAASQPSYFTRFKNFCKRHHVVRRALFATAILVGLALFVTGAVFTAGALPMVLPAIVAPTVISTFLTSTTIGATILAGCGGAFGFLAVCAASVFTGLAAFGGAIALNAPLLIKPRNKPVTSNTPENESKPAYVHRPWATPSVSATPKTAPRLTDAQKAEGVRLASDVFPEIRARMQEQRQASTPTPAAAAALNKFGMHATVNASNPTPAETLTPPQQCTIL